MTSAGQREKVVKDGSTLAKFYGVRMRAYGSDRSVSAAANHCARNGRFAMRINILPVMRRKPNFGWGIYRDWAAYNPTIAFIWLWGYQIELTWFPRR